MGGFRSGFYSTDYYLGNGPVSGSLPPPQKKKKNSGRKMQVEQNTKSFQKAEFIYLFIYFHHNSTIIIIIDMESYKKANKAVKKDLRIAKERWINEKCEIIENNLHRNPKQAYKDCQKTY